VVLQSAGEVVTGELPDEKDTRTPERLDSRDLLAVNTLGQLAKHPRVGALRRFITGWYLSYLSADNTFRIKQALQPLGPGEQMEPRPRPVNPPYGQQPQNAPMPRGRSGRPAPPQGGDPRDSLPPDSRGGQPSGAYGSVAIRVRNAERGERLVFHTQNTNVQLGGDGRYRIEGRDLDSDGLCEMLLGWLDRYPIVSIEDPLAEDDAEGMKKFTAAAGHKVQIIGDDFLVTNANRVRAAADAGACNAVLIKPNQAGTVTETKAALDAAKRVGWGTIVSARSGETEDVTIVHLAAGWDAGQLKVGSFARSERTSKWNEALRIEESLAGKTSFAGRDVLAKQARE